MAGRAEALGDCAPFLGLRLPLRSFDYSRKLFAFASRLNMPRIPVSTDSILTGLSLLLFAAVLAGSIGVGLGDKFSFSDALLPVGV